MVAAALITAGYLLTRSPAGVMLGSGMYLLYSIGSRTLLLRAHRRGIRLSKRQCYPEAIEAYRESYEFLSRYWWIDEYRSLVLMSPSAISYREMALVNTAFCYMQLGDAVQGREFYLRALDEFPDSGMAQTALAMIDAIERTVLSTGEP